MTRACPKRHEDNPYVKYYYYIPQPVHHYHTVV